MYAVNYTLPTQGFSSPNAPLRDEVCAVLLLIDNYDSFTYNLVHYLGELGAEMSVHRNDRLSVADALAMKPSGILLSPGP